MEHTDIDQRLATARQLVADDPELLSVESPVFSATARLIDRCERRQRTLRASLTSYT